MVISSSAQFNPTLKIISSRALSLRNLVFWGHECGRIFSAGVGLD